MLSFGASSKQIGGILSDPLHFAAIRMQASRLTRLADPMVAVVKAAGTKQRAKKYADDPHHRNAYRAVGCKLTAPIVFLQRIIVGTLGEPIGSFATLPDEIDSIARAAWGKIYKGVASNVEQLVDSFITKYGQFMFHREEFVLGDLDPHDFMKHCIHRKVSAGGLDGWGTDDLSILDNLLKSIPKPLKINNKIIDKLLKKYIEDAVSSKMMYI